MLKDKPLVSYQTKIQEWLRKSRSLLLCECSCVKKIKKILLLLQHNVEPWTSWNNFFSIVYLIQQKYFASYHLHALILSQYALNKKTEQTSYSYSIHLRNFVKVSFHLFSFHKRFLIHFVCLVFVVFSVYSQDVSLSGCLSRCVLRAWLREMKVCMSGKGPLK